MPTAALIRLSVLQRLVRVERLAVRLMTGHAAVIESGGGDRNDAVRSVVSRFTDM